ncbi:uncharacterized protein I303_101046 [Kwoniella dejecticola CBS 10117]|uniref:Uncharacterized protein n=1 Tax=Kwoniella dejecticola CBS 10117 TaxID=1296121 RepID=A0A1A6AGT7_9TREE|nr:uncharacterized protein I303_01048 [Kwoniella dejecticola CBS 10117]OBR89223.1 hypothetical protein I303_01048 [Kwoniella dejecticola CBS 10117]
MVRFKNRYLLMEFLVPSTFSSNLSVSPTSRDDLRLTEEERMNIDIDGDPEHSSDDDDDGDDDDDDGLDLMPIPKAPFLLSTARPSLGLGDEAASQQAIYKAIRGAIQDVFGDEGWARVASSFRVIYHSPLTTLTFIRIARPYYRLIWSGLTFLTSLGPGSGSGSKNSGVGASVNVIPRVIGVSGTIKKMQNKGIAYHRLIIARMITHSAAASLSSSTTQGGQAQEGQMRLGGGNEPGRLEKEGQREREDISRLDEA